MGQKRQGVALFWEGRAASSKSSAVVKGSGRGEFLPGSLEELEPSNSGRERCPDSSGRVKRRRRPMVSGGACLTYYLDCSP